MTRAGWGRRAAALATVVALAGCGSDDGTGSDGPAREPAPAPSSSTPPPTTQRTSPERTTAGPAVPARGKLRLVAKELEVPWDIDFLPGGDALVTERDSRKLIRIPADGGPLETVMTVPGVVAEGEGGLLGVAVSPRYAQDGFVYVYFTAARDNRIARIDLDTGRMKTILSGIQKGSNHNGGALAFGPDGKLYAGVGEAGVPELSQNRASLNGKILRLETTGKPAEGNPLRRSPVWSLGHRNVQGLAWDSAGQLWATEFGQNDVDEVNLIRRGRNYGWPVVEGRGDGQAGKYTSPVVTWSPTSESSPSGGAIIGDELYVGALAGQRLWRIGLEENTTDDPESLLEGQLGRIRAVTVSPRGTIWFSTSNRDGRGDPADIDDRIFELGVAE